MTTLLAKSLKTKKKEEDKGFCLKCAYVKRGNEQKVVITFGCGQEALNRDWTEAAVVNDATFVSLNV